MGKEFKGFAIPQAVDTPEGRKCVREGYQLKRNYCFIEAVSLCTGGRSCAKCIACLNCGDAVLKREVFEQYEREFPVKGKVGMPELKPGMVVRIYLGNYYLIVSEGEKDYLAYRYTIDDNGNPLLGWFRSFTKDDLSIEAIYGDAVSGWFLPIALRDIYRGEERHLIWKRPDPVKEMTVDEISKALGYKVKVVGSEKADD